jgi:hypothetical protein
LTDDAVVRHSSPAYLARQDTGNGTENGASLSKMALPQSNVVQRKRLISFRLSEDEYEGLKRLSGEHGARSLSDFVRSNVCVMLSAPKPWEEDVECTVREFGRQASQLNGLVDQLGHLLRTTPGRVR